jgi:uncharacterized membrane protein
VSCSPRIGFVVTIAAITLIGFLGSNLITQTVLDGVERTLERHQAIAHPNIEEILAADTWARDEILKLANGDSQC